MAASVSDLLDAPAEAKVHVPTEAAHAPRKGARVSDEVAVFRGLARCRARAALAHEARQAVLRHGARRVEWAEGHRDVARGPSVPNIPKQITHLRARHVIEVGGGAVELAGHDAGPVRGPEDMPELVRNDDPVSGAPGRAARDRSVRDAAAGGCPTRRARPRLRAPGHADGPQPREPHRPGAIAVRQEQVCSRSLAVLPAEE